MRRRIGCSAPWNWKSEPLITLEQRGVGAEWDMKNATMQQCNEVQNLDKFSIAASHTETAIYFQCLICFCSLNNECTLTESADSLPSEHSDNQMRILHTSILSSEGNHPGCPPLGCRTTVKTLCNCQSSLPINIVIWVKGMHKCKVIGKCYLSG